MKFYKFLNLSRFAVFFLLLSSEIHTFKSANIIFDMEGVLVTRSNISFLYNMGLRNFIGFFNPFSLQTVYFDFLANLIPRNPNAPRLTENGRLLPQILCDWLTGKKRNAEIKEIIKQGLHTHKNFFSSKGQKNLIEKMCNFIFTPEQLISVIDPVKHAITLALKCANTNDKWGQKNRIFILSNWEPESFLLFFNNKQIHKVFSLCDGIIVSGCIGKMKPDPEIYKYMLTQCNIDPSQELTIFIDDMEENLQAAKRFNIHTIKCEKLNLSTVENQLYQLGALV